MIKNIGIIGVGGVGGYFGGKLCRAAAFHNQNIFFLARGTHLKAIQKNGLTLNTISDASITCHPALASDKIEQFPKLDLCILAVKGFDLINTLTSLKMRTTENTMILPLLNGINIDAQVRGILPRCTIFPGCAYISSRIEQPGVVTQTGGPCSIILGKDPVHPSASPDEILRLFKEAGISHQWTENANPKIWEKFIFIAPFSLITACFDKSVGEVIASPKLSRHVRAIMNEIVQLAEKMEIQFSGDIVTTIFEKAENFPSDTRTSFQNDFSKSSKRDEREIFGGTLLRLCKKEGIDCKVTEEIYQKLKEIKPDYTYNSEAI